MAHLVEVENVNIKIKNRQILSDINLKFEKGKIYGLLGPNGAGKTTLLKSLLGVFKPTSGNILFNKHNIYNNPSMNIMKKLEVLLNSQVFMQI